MPLTAPQPRQHLHTRTITVKGYAREDGLWDIEGHMTDNKTYVFKNDWRGDITPDIPIHEMWVRLTLDDTFTVVDAEAASDHTPLAICGRITPAYKQLVGLRIVAGWNRKIKELFGGEAGCTHITELLGPIGTVAFQTIGVELNRRRRLAADDNAGIVPEDDGSGPKPAFVGGCHAWATDGEFVKQRFPRFYTGE